MNPSNGSNSQLVSVIIPTYGRPRQLVGAVESVLSQRYPHIELIVVDDNNPGSAGRRETEDLMSRYSSDERVKYIKHQQNRNGSAARNTGIRTATGQFLMFLDDDDEFLPGKIERQVECLRTRGPAWGVCYGAYLRKKNGKVVARSAEKREGALLAEELMRNLFVHAGSNLMIRAEIARSIGGFNEDFARNQDIEFLTRALQVTKLAYVDHLGLVVHVHARAGEQDFEKLTEQYREQFKDLIAALPDSDQHRVERLLNLQLLRYRMSRRGMRPALRMLIQREVTLSDAVRYGLHLTKRSLTRQAYGFQLH